MLATLAGCMAYHNRNSTGAVKTAKNSCKQYGEVDLQPGWFDDSYRYFLENAVEISSIPDFNISVPVDVPVILNGTMILLYKDAYDQFLGNYDNSFYYGAGALGYWLLVMVLGAVNTWSRFLFPGLIKKLSFGPINWWREYVSMPATFRKKKAQEQKLLKIFDFLIPSRYETLVVTGFYAYIIAVHSIKYHFVSEVPIFESKYDFQLRNVADRTGIVATVMMPLVFLYAGRNNILQWFTGWSYNTFMTYHRHLARVMFLLVVIHSVTFSVELGEYYSEDMADTYLIWGTIATVSSGIIIFQAMLFFRRNWYEIFLLIHIIMAALYIAGTWIHVDELGYVWFCYATVAPWCFDRLVRIVRLFAFGFPKAKVTLLANDTIKVEIPKPSYWKSVPGGHAFIHFIKPTYFWQSHPFTFVDSPHDSHIILYCKVKGGITHSLYRTLVNNPGQTATIRVGVEGPYGESTPAKYADSAVFIAGGNGIPGLYSEIMDIARCVTNETKKKLKLIWIIREYKSLEWFTEELEILKNTTIETTIYVTKPECNGDIANYLDMKEEEEEEKEEDGSKNSKSEGGVSTSSISAKFAHITFTEGRPSIEGIVNNEVHEANGSVAFVSCGHPVMVDEVRYYACENINNSEKKRVDFFEQVQVWA
ncbi:hypothetical protein G210_1392 [Candida maltosa Xu316]|uniref:ferric-chelate reductase (NADPH) n=1 Tax=Candida maltosa (strain Xu316) TaxID=1245528 RepID=M3INX8_CANMX|nr:hypothetical protein G210_1392 [Candida maltosa Xu316]